MGEQLRLDAINVTFKHSNPCNNCTGLNARVEVRRERGCGLMMCAAHTPIYTKLPTQKYSRHSKPRSISHAELQNYSVDGTYGPCTRSLGAV